MRWASTSPATGLSWHARTAKGYAHPTREMHHCCDVGSLVTPSSTTLSQSGPPHPNPTGLNLQQKPTNSENSNSSECMHARLLLDGRLSTPRLLGEASGLSGCVCAVCQPCVPCLKGGVFAGGWKSPSPGPKQKQEIEMRREPGFAGSGPGGAARCWVGLRLGCDGQWP